MFRYSLVAAVLCGCVASAAFAGKPIPDDLRAMLDKAESIEVFSLDPEPDAKGADSFHGYKILGKTAVKDKDERKKLVEALAKGVEGNDGKVAKCFEPRHGVRVIQDGKTLDLVICFQCLQIQVYIDGKAQNGMLTTASPQAAFDKVLKDAKVPLAPKPGD